MRLSELIGMRIRDAEGAEIGVLRDLLAERVPPGKAAGARFEIRGLVIGRAGYRDEAAHAWGFAVGRAEGPAIIRRLLASACADARYVPVEWVSSWDDECVTLECGAKDLQPVAEAGL